MLLLEVSSNNAPAAAVAVAAQLQNYGVKLQSKSPGIAELIFKVPTRLFDSRYIWEKTNCQGERQLEENTGPYE